MVNICDNVAQTSDVVLALTEYIVIEMTIGAGKLVVVDRSVVALALAALVKRLGGEDPLYPLLLKIQNGMPAVRAHILL